MHIPDGYLSPETCAALYAAVAPFWYTALNKMKRLLQTRLVPLLSLFAAFSFVIMMFNLPLPGGTTGHAAGMGIASIVLGSWASMLAISVALLIQAIFFGDGGITTFGANALNMAVVGSLVASFTYQLIAGKSALSSKRRIIAAGLAGYAAINAAALCTAIEFGLQPMLFKDATGAPLYAPYPLSIAIPAMMIGHITFAGLAEMIITAGVVAYLQKADISLLKLTAPNVVEHENGVTNVPQKGNALRTLWVGMALLMIITPLGLLAAGSAWGEWSPEDLADAKAREEIAAASGNHTLPEKAPKGLEKLAKVWTAPIPDYAPTFMHSEKFGYMMSAMFGSGLVIITMVLLNWLFGRRDKDAGKVAE